MITVSTHDGNHPFPMHKLRSLAHNGRLKVAGIPYNSPLMLPQSLKFLMRAEIEHDRGLFLTPPSMSIASGEILPRNPKV